MNYCVYRVIPKSIPVLSQELVFKYRPRPDVTHLLRQSRYCHQYISGNEVKSDEAIISKKFVKPNIPFRIERGPTDILKALADTVGIDTTAPHYKFYDDPYLHPLSNTEKKNYALSRESGKKVARWIRDTNGDLFNHQPDDPVIKKFLPKFVFDENSDIKEQDLKNSIKNFLVSDSVKLYRLCQSKGIEISADTRQSLLELVSFSNCEDMLDEDWIEERRAQFVKIYERPVKSWKDRSIAEELFEELKENGSKPYCALIRGMSAYYQFDKCWNLYQQALNENISLDTETFNAVIRLAPGLREDNDLRWELTREILEKMAELRVVPNLDTMNSVLESLAYCKGWGKGMGLSLNVLSEFRDFNIEPCLATYYWLLRIYYSFGNSRNQMLPSILQKIKGKNFKPENKYDMKFFVLAMDIANTNLKNFEVADQIHKLLLTGNNSLFINSTTVEQHYYQSYFVLATQSMTLEEFMKIYDTYVPNIYSPNQTVMGEIIRMLSLYDEIALLPRIWSDCIQLELVNSERLMELTLMVINNYELEAADKQLQERLRNIAWDIWERVENQPSNRAQRVEWTGKMLGDLVSTLTRCGDVDAAFKIFEDVSNNPVKLIGVLPTATMKLLLRAARDGNNRRQTDLVYAYAREYSHDLKELEEGQADESSSSSDSSLSDSESSDEESSERESIGKAPRGSGKGGETGEAQTESLKDSDDTPK